jgi:hypothetical protein
MIEIMIEQEQEQQREEDIQNMSYELRDHTNKSTNINNEHFMCEEVTADEDFMNTLSELISSNRSHDDYSLDDIQLLRNLRVRAKDLADEIATNERG